MSFLPSSPLLLLCVLWPKGIISWPSQWQSFLFNIVLSFSNIACLGCNNRHENGPLELDKIAVSKNQTDRCGQVKLGAPPHAACSGKAEASTSDS